MSPTLQLLLALCIYILIGYGFLHAQLWLAIKSLEHYPNAELEALIALTQNNVFIRIFMVGLWPVVIICATASYVLDKVRHKH